MCVIRNKGNFKHTKQLLQSNKILNAYPLNILNAAGFMYEVNQKTAPNVFLSRLQKPCHFCPNRFSELNYVQPILKRVNSQFQLEDHISRIAFLAPKKKQITIMHKLIIAITQLKLLFLENVLTFFLRELFLFVRLYENLICLQF